MKEELSAALVNEGMDFASLKAQAAEFFSDEEMWVHAGLVLIKVFLIIVLSIVVVKVLKAVIRRIFTLKVKGPLKYSERRQRTLLKLLQNVAAYIVYFAAVLAVLSALSINVAGLIAGAGVLGLAVGFGAQSLVKDVITGFFIIFEDQFSVGDFVRIGTAEGTVEEIGLRTTKIKAFTGELFILPNGSITDVVNFSIHNSIAVVDVSISYESDIPAAERLIQEFLEEIEGKYEEIISPPQLLGVQNLGASEVVMRITAETLPMQHFAVARGIRRDLKIFLDEHGIEIPYPRMVMMQRSPEEPAPSSTQKK